jgi:hypothetical protein
MAPEMYRVKGDLLLAQDPGGAGAAETWYRRALAVATERGAATLRLRAATSLARLLAAVGRRDEAAGVLGAALAPLTEGAGTADVRDARALAAELAAEPEPTAAPLPVEDRV